MQSFAYSNIRELSFGLLDLLTVEPDRAVVCVSAAVRSVLLPKAQQTGFLLTE